MTLDEAGVALGNESFKVREEAEQVIRMAGMDEYDRIARLAHSDNPEVAARGRRSLPIVLLGIDDRFPPDLAAKLRRIDDFSGRDLDPIVDALKSLDPPRPVTLIGLHSHWQAQRPDFTEATGKVIASLEQGIHSVLRTDTVLTELNRLHPDRYQAQTLAMVLNGLCKQRPDDLIALLPLNEAWTRAHPRLPELLNADGYQLVVAREANMTPDRVEALGKILNYEATRTLSPAQMAAVQQAVQAALRGEGVLTDLSRLNPERYETETLAMVLDELCKQHPGDLSAVMPLHESWTRSHPQLLEQLNADGYRLEVTKESSKAPTRTEGMRKILNLATKHGLTNDQMAAVRKQLLNYRDEAATFPVDTLDRDAGWYFFDVFGSDQGGQVYLDAYLKFRTRFPEISEKSLLAQPMEVLRVCDKSGAGAALEYSMLQTNHGGVMLLAAWLHDHPELIREPLPLPPVKDGEAYKYRTIKFFRIFAPYADDAEMNRHPEIAAAFGILTKDPGWIEVAKQARAVMTQQQQEARPPAR